jgi:hypothetical protein
MAAGEQKLAVSLISSDADDIEAQREQFICNVFRWGTAR